MGVIVSKTFIGDALTPICSMCGIQLCWDISFEEYDERPIFWETWRCRECRHEFIPEKEVRMAKPLEYGDEEPEDY